MAITNRERVEQKLALLRQGLGPFVEREIVDALKSRLSLQKVRVRARLNAGGQTGVIRFR